MLMGYGKLDCRTKRRLNGTQLEWVSFWHFSAQAASTTDVSYRRQS
jgi:hypothetical protein